MARAGEQPWPRAFHNRRASRRTELGDPYPTHVACAWPGNGETVARSHSVWVRDANFDRANGSADDGAETAAHGPAQRMPESHGEPRQTATADADA